MQIIDLAIKLNHLNENKVTDVCSFISFFSSTYVRVNLNYHLDNPNNIKNKEFDDLLLTENTLADLDHSYFFRTFTIDLNKINKRIINYMNKNGFSLIAKTDSLSNIEILKSFKGKIELIYEIDKKANLVDVYELVKSKGYKQSLRLKYKDDNNSSMINSKGIVEKYSDLFNHWLNDKEGLMLKNFEHFVDASFGGSYKDCYNDACINKRYYLDENNDIYTCDKPCLKNYKYGNIKDFRNLKNIYESKIFSELSGKLASKNNTCSACSCYKSCNGGCMSDSIKNAKDVNALDNNYCTNYQEFLNYVKGVVDELTKNRVSLKELNPHFKEILIDSLRMDIRL